MTEAVNQPVESIPQANPEIVASRQPSKLRKAVAVVAIAATAFAGSYGVSKHINSPDSDQQATEAPKTPESPKTSVSPVDDNQAETNFDDHSDETNFVWVMMDGNCPRVEFNFPDDTVTHKADTSSQFCENEGSISSYQATGVVGNKSVNQSTETENNNEVVIKWKETEQEEEDQVDETEKDDKQEEEDQVDETEKDDKQEEEDDKQEEEEVEPETGPTIFIYQAPEEPAQEKTVSATAKNVDYWLVERVDNGDCDADSLKYGSRKVDNDPSVTLNLEKYNGDRVCFGAMGHNGLLSHELSEPVTKIDRTPPDGKLSYDRDSESGNSWPKWEVVDVTATDKNGVDDRTWQIAKINHYQYCDQTTLDNEGIEVHTDNPKILFEEEDNGKRACFGVRDLAGNVKYFLSRVISGIWGTGSDLNAKPVEDSGLKADREPTGEEITCTDMETSEVLEGPEKCGL